jgi:hypothetical protein
MGADDEVEHERHEDRNHRDSEGGEPASAKDRLVDREKCY